MLKCQSEESTLGGHKAIDAFGVLNFSQAHNDMTFIHENAVLRILFLCKFTFCAPTLLGQVAICLSDFPHQEEPR